MQLGSIGEMAGQKSAWIIPASQTAFSGDGDNFDFVIVDKDDVTHTLAN
jgi:hypothetical protein